MLTTLLLSLFLLDSSYFSVETGSDEKIWILTEQDENSGLYSPSSSCGCDKCKETEEELYITEETASSLLIRGDAKELMVLPMSQRTKAPLTAYFERRYAVEVVGMTDLGQIIVSKTLEDLPEFLIEDSTGFAILEPNEL